MFLYVLQLTLDSTLSMEGDLEIGIVEIHASRLCPMSHASAFCDTVINPYGSYCRM